MGGKIGVESRVGTGSRFWFTLPLPIAAMIAPGANAALPAASAPIAAKAGRGQRILLAEDVLINQIIAIEMLKTAGYQVDVADNGLEAVEAVQHQLYDLILMDVHMPSMDGIGATRKIRALEPPRGKIPIVALTADAIAGVREQYLAAGMDDFLSKPFNRTELLAVVERWLTDVADTAPAAVASTPAAAAPAPAEIAAPRSTVLDADKIRELAEIMSRDEFTKLMTTWLKSTRERVDQIVALAKTDNFAAVRAHATTSSAPPAASAPCSFPIWRAVSKRPVTTATWRQPASWRRRSALRLNPRARRCAPALLRPAHDAR